MKRKEIISSINHILFGCTVIVLCLGKLSATAYYVSLSGNDTWPGTSPDSAWRHIAYGTGQIQTGDTLLILAGNYGNEQADIANSGTLSTPIVIKADTSGQVIMQGDGSGSGVWIEGNSHIVIEGIRFTNFSVGVFIYHVGSHITVKKCAFVENNDGGFLTWGTSSNISLCHHIVATENQFSDYTDKQDYGVYFCYATNCVANNNYFFGQHHQALSFKRRVHTGIAKNNIFEGFLYSALYLGQNLDSPGDTNRSHNLIAEGNTFCPAQGYRAKRPIWVANVERAVVRNNFMEGKDDVDGGWGEGIALGDYVSGYDPANPTHITIYNNVMRRIGGTTTNPGIRVYHDCHDVRVFNNTFTDCAYGLGFEVEDTLFFQNNIFNNYQYGMIREGTAENDIFRYNDIYPYWAGAGPTNISVDPLFVGPFDPLELPVEDPYFIPDFSRAMVCQLQVSSPCIDTGACLTTTVGSGSGSEIAVEDAGYFTDGYGIGEGDLIRVGANESLRIVEIDYDNNIITVDQSISWSNNDGVSLPYYGSVPDMGAYEYSLVGIRENERVFSGLVPFVLKLEQNYPNPFATQTQIKYVLPKQSEVRLSIYNTAGQEVRTLVNTDQKPGFYTAHWNGKDQEGKKTASGVYFYRLATEDYSSTKKLLILR
ncbi:MAG: T9SS type A sorting domain-containing protein [bacterium]